MGWEIFRRGMYDLNNFLALKTDLPTSKLGHSIAYREMILKVAELELRTFRTALRNL